MSLSELGARYRCWNRKDSGALEVDRLIDKIGLGSKHSRIWCCLTCNVIVSRIKYIIAGQQSAFTSKTKHVLNNQRFVIISRAKLWMSQNLNTLLKDHNICKMYFAMIPWPPCNNSLAARTPYFKLNWSVGIKILMGSTLHLKIQPEKKRVSNSKWKYSTYRTNRMVEALGTVRSYLVETNKVSMALCSFWAKGEYSTTRADGMIGVLCIVSSFGVKRPNIWRFFARFESWAL